MPQKGENESHFTVFQSWVNKHLLAEILTWAIVYKCAKEFKKSKQRMSKNRRVIWRHFSESSEMNAIKGSQLWHPSSVAVSDP